MHVLRLLVIATALAASPMSAVATEMDLEMVLVGSASTPAQHKALADYYRGKAEAATKEAKEHREMAKAFGGNKLALIQNMVEHSNKLAALNEEMATQYKMLADAQDTLAK